MNEVSVNLAVAKIFVKEVIASGIALFLTGPPGLGKSDTFKEVAKEENLFLIDERLSTKEPTDLSGYPAINPKTLKSYNAPFETFPLDTDEIPEGYSGWLLVLDELNHAPMSVQKAA